MQFINLVAKLTVSPHWLAQTWVSLFRSWKSRLAEMPGFLSNLSVEVLIKVFCPAVHEKILLFDFRLRMPTSGWISNPVSEGFHQLYPLCNAAQRCNSRISESTVVWQFQTVVLVETTSSFFSFLQDLRPIIILHEIRLHF